MVSAGITIERRPAERTNFLNVDLDLDSKTDLQPVVDALGKKVAVLHVGRVGLTFQAHLVLNTYTNNADVTIRRFCKLIDSLPADARALWDKAKTRDFNIGVQAAAEPYVFEIALAAKTVKAASAVGARIVFSVYAPEERLSSGSRTRRRSGT